jgi:hypothetical protein
MASRSFYHDLAISKLEFAKSIFGSAGMRQCSHPLTNLSFYDWIIKKTIFTCWRMSVYK